jgi:uncharacterized protein
MSDYTEELETERAMKDRFMATHVESPFVAERIPGFEGLRYFPIDEGFRVQARLVRRPVPEEAYLRTNRDGQASMRYVGDLEFRIGGRALKLRVYHAGEGVGTSVFIPFRDATSGADSYGPGRYLVLDLNEDDDYDLDFNRAFNPYCAYTEAFECGFPPAENDLPVEVRAGEKAWALDRNPRTPSSVVRALSPRPAPRPSTGSAPRVRRSARRPAPRAPARRGRASKPARAAARSRSSR